MSTQKKSVYQVLSDIHVADKLEKKGKLDYLSWASAWALVKNKYPDVKRTVYETEDGVNYFHDHKTAWVKVGITINNIEHIDYLPIMNTNGRPFSKKLESITSFDVNTSIQRSTVKALALHGLGLAVYIGEDLQNIEDDLDSKPIPKAPTISKVKETKKRLPTGDFNKDLMTIKKSIDAGKTWEEAKTWLESSDDYGEVEITKFKTAVNEN